MYDEDLVTALVSRFRDLFGGSVDLEMAMVPGRVNLIGEHTDYNDGWALPMAIDRYVGVAFRPRDDQQIRAHAVAFDETVQIDLDALTLPLQRSWVSYVIGMARIMTDSGLEIRGIDCVIDGNLPLGAGLSSSAALEMAIGRALCAAAGVPWQRREMARLGQQAEDQYVGVRCGPMDQLTSACAEPGCALLLDCRSLRTESVPIPQAARVVVMDSGVRRALATSAYNARRASCDDAITVLRRLDPAVAALRDVDLALLEAARSQMSELTYRRARHVIEENRRPGAMAAALQRGRLDEAGRLMNDSHRSLRDLYEVSSSELDRITNLARRHGACFGARLTGAGFGGCAVALVATEGVDSFADDIHRAYIAEFDLPSRLFATEPVAGARLCELATTLGTAPPRPPRRQTLCN